MLVQSGRLSSMVKLKELAQKYLKQDSTLRNLIMSEPDYLPRDEAIVKVQIYSKLLEHELRQLHNVKAEK